MTELRYPALRQIALKALAQRAGSAAEIEAIAAAAQRAYDDLAHVSVPLIGKVGIDALTGRALYLLQSQYPWLALTREPGQWTGPFAQILFALKQQSPDVGKDAAGAVFATLAGLLAALIGEPLTTEDGIVMGDTLSEYEGLLTGDPVLASAAAGKAGGKTPRRRRLPKLDDERP